jgi:hypothetical protein
MFERYWSHQLNRVKERAERAEAQIHRDQKSNENS